MQSTGQCPNFFMMFTFQNVMLCQSQRHVIATECTRLHPVLTCFESILKCLHAHARLLPCYLIHFEIKKPLHFTEMQVNSQGRSYRQGVGLSRDMKSLIIDELYRRGGDRLTQFVPVGSYTPVSNAIKVSLKRVKKVWLQYCNHYTLEGKKAGGDRRSKLKSEDLELIELMKKYKGSVSLKEIYSIMEELGNIQGDISISSISRALKSRMESGKTYTRKKITHVASQRFAYNNLLYTQIFMDYLSSKNPNSLKFFDEAGVKYPNVGMRLYGHAPKGERCVEVVKKCESPNATINMIVSLNGTEYYDIIDGASNTYEFLNFFGKASNAVNLQTLRPALEIGDILVMDNLSVHHYESGEVLEEYLQEMGVELLYTPVFSPDLNPIEHSFNKIKTVTNLKK